MIEIDYKDYKICLNGSSVVYFGANWCRDCRFAKPILEELAKIYTNVKFYNIDVDANEGVREKMNIRHIPTILFLKDGVEICSRLVEPKNADIIKECINKL